LLVAGEGPGISSLSLRRERIVAVAVPVPDLTIRAIDEYIAAFVAGNVCFIVIHHHEERLPVTTRYVKRLFPDGGVIGRNSDGPDQTHQLS
jgi:hypothetical protein